MKRSQIANSRLVASFCLAERSRVRIAGRRNSRGILRPGPCAPINTDVDWGKPSCGGSPGSSRFVVTAVVAAGTGGRCADCSGAPTLRRARDIHLLANPRLDDWMTRTVTRAASYVICLARAGEVASKANALGIFIEEFGA